MDSRIAKYCLGAVLVVFLAASFFYLHHRGDIRRGSDTGIYTGGAERLSRGAELIGNQNWHPGYIALVAVFTKVDPRLKGLVVFHILLAALAGLAIYDLGCALASPLCGLLAAVMFLWNPDIARWHFYVLTESVYISVVILFVWSLFKYIERPKPPPLRLGFLILMTLITASLRPNGWLLVPLAFSVGASHNFKITGRHWALLLAAMIVFSIGFVLFPGTQRAIQYVEPASLLRQGIVVWDFPEWNLSMPLSPAPTSAMWTGDLHYVLANFIPCLRLGLARIAAEVLHVRPFYSQIHNAAVFLYVIPLYALAILGYKQSEIPLLKSSIAAVIAVQLIYIALVCADWDGRFLLYIFPLVSLLAAVSISYYLKKLIWVRSS